MVEVTLLVPPVTVSPTVKAALAPLKYTIDWLVSCSTIVAVELLEPPVMVSPVVYVPDADDTTNVTVPKMDKG
jgi:hypothetical protein